MMRRTLEEPTKQERDEYNLTHTPFRSWCPLFAFQARRSIGLIDGGMEMMMMRFLLYILIIGR